jgi:hypothetical protein
LRIAINTKEKCNLQKLRNAKPIKTKIVTFDRSMEALALLCQSNYQINMLRRELMKTNMKGEYSHLCSYIVKYTSYLSWDDVPKTVKEIGDCSRISNKLSSFATQQRSDRGFSNRNRPGNFRGRRSLFQNWSTQGQNRGYSGYSDPKNFRGRRGSSRSNISK